MEINQVINQEIIEDKQYVAFGLNDEIYAVDIKMVKIVEKYVAITRVPKSSVYIRGVINLRGEIIPVIDLRLRFNMSAIEEMEETRVMVLKIDDMQIGALVDCVYEVINIPVEDIESASNVTSSISSNYVVGLGKQDGRVITILNFEKLIKDEKY